jgi:general secretion pathway protein G
MNRQRRSGLTLLELMIVLIILVMLFAIAGPRLLGQQKKADIRLTTAQIGNFESALKNYYMDMRSYPSTEEGLVALISRPTDENKARKWDPEGYLDDEAIPADAWDNAYIYEYPPSQGSRDFPNISSAGPDGQPNTEDDIVNWRGGASDGASGTKSGPASTGIDAIDNAGTK